MARYQSDSMLGAMFRLFDLRDCRCGVRGLPNEHLSCCVNSILQTLSATWELADLLEKWEASGVKAEAWSVPLQLSRALAAMRSEPPRPAPHRDLLRCLDRHCVRLNTQHDADEVFVAIMNLMQQQMEDRSTALEIQNLYRLSVETHVQCLQCSSVQSQSSYLLSLPLHIQEDHNSLEGCLKSFFEPQELGGINCCFCPACESKTPSKKGFKLLSLPPILCLHLKRFRSSSGRTRKLGCTVTFPESLDLLAAVRDAFPSDCVQAACRYALYAVVVHSGSAHFGHYTAYVRDRTDRRWYYADDSHVQQASWEDVQGTYGDRHRSTAYMLMYRRGSAEEHRE
ncbi:ubl carboxyl-terminal hydrolase 18 [Betta splendens]|uniref:Ubl carboxyl-terminal hydrolase 18 n=1 Tax=Betta splendens TaxID=158456 RepID=A0A6P7NLN6_BETSP|nr:ubl carboxyl-terminal hydrolase 18 [Betta splendens]